MTKPNQQSRRRFLRHSGAAVAALGGAGIVATSSASADSDSQGILADGFGDISFDIGAFVSGYASRYSSGYGSPDDVDDLVDRARNEFNANTDHWVNYGNWLLEEQDLTGAGDVTVGVDVAVTRWRWPTRDERLETMIDVAYDDSSDEFTDIEWLAEPADDPDFEIVIQDSAAENAADELSEFRRDYIDESGDGDHTVPDDEYLNELGGRYAGSIGAGSNAQSVLEMLLGEVDVDGF